MVGKNKMDTKIYIMTIHFEINKFRINKNLQMAAAAELYQLTEDTRFVNRFTNTQPTYK